jgi:hypothetical protein
MPDHERLPIFPAMRRVSSRRVPVLAPGSDWRWIGTVDLSKCDLVKTIPAHKNGKEKECLYRTVNGAYLQTFAADGGAGESDPDNPYAWGARFVSHEEAAKWFMFEPEMAPPDLLPWVQLLYDYTEATTDLPDLTHEQKYYPPTKSSAIEATTNHITSAPPTDRTPADRRHLGLELDKDKLQIRRDGFPSVSLTRPLLWSLLEVLMKRGGAFAGERAIRDAWASDEHGGPEPSTVRDALSQLRKELEPLCIGIENERGFGWRLVAR